MKDSLIVDGTKGIFIEQEISHRKFLTMFVSLINTYGSNITEVFEQQRIINNQKLVESNIV